MINTGLAINQEIRLSGRTVVVKRLDLLDHEISGNKWYKLKYNLEVAAVAHHRTLLTFGGAWSNHIYATAAAGKRHGIRTIGIIRGEEPLSWSPTLKFARECGMELVFITREAYAEKETEDFKGWLHEEFGSFHLVPEGGSNFLGINGCMEILSQKDKEEFDLICCACGTAATLAGMVLSSNERQRFIGFSALKSGSFLYDQVRGHITRFLGSSEAADDYKDQFKIETRYDFGGYAKWNDELLSFMNRFEQETGVPTDQVYTGKMFFGLSELLSGEEIRAERILVIHSGGLQGRASLK